MLSLEDDINLITETFAGDTKSSEASFLFFLFLFFFFLSLKLPNLTVKLSLIFWTQVMWRVAESSHTNYHTGWGRVKGALDVCVPCYLLKEK